MTATSCSTAERATSPESSGETKIYTSSTPYFPPNEGDWESVAPEAVGWNAQALSAALTFAGEHKSTAVVILHHGRIIGEKYWALDDAPMGLGEYTYRVFRVGSTPEGRPVEDVASIQKSAISLLAGIALERNILQRDAPVTQYLGAGWSKATRTAESRINIQHLLSMSSGLTESLEYDAPSGQRWFYNTQAYSQLIEVLTRVSKKEANSYTSEWLSNRLGMKNTRWVIRDWLPEGRNRYGLATTARDLARIGLLVLADGLWQDERIISQSYLREMLQPSQSLNPAYGLLWWLNGQDGWQDWDHKGLKPGSFIPTAPNDLVAARGFGDHRLYVVPSLNLVVTRLGGTAMLQDKEAELHYFDHEFWRRLMKAVPTGPVQR